MSSSLPVGDAMDPGPAAGTLTSGKEPILVPEKGGGEAAADSSLEDFQDASETLAPVEGGEPSAPEALAPVDGVDGGDPMDVVEEGVDEEGGDVGDGGERVCVEVASETLISVGGGDSSSVAKENPGGDGGGVHDSEAINRARNDRGDPMDAVKNVSETLVSVDGGDSRLVAKANPIGDGGEFHDSEAVDEAKNDGGDPKDVTKSSSETQVSVDGGDSSLAAKEDPSGDGGKIHDVEAVDEAKDDGGALIDVTKSAYETPVSVGREDSSSVAKDNPNGDGDKVHDLEDVDEAKTDGGDPMDVAKSASESPVSVGGGDSSIVGEENPNGEREKDNMVLEAVGEVKKDGGDRRIRYDLNGEEEKAVFSVTDMVWGKVKSHPWWPGQIFDPKYASDMASKHQKKDQFLVAYFGDKTFAWCEPSQLKPFRSHFAQMEKQSSTDALANAIEAAVEEASRQVELGMSCHCMADETYADLKYRKVENAGIREGTCSCVVDKGSIVNSFKPERLMQYFRTLATCPSEGFDMLELATAKAQLKAFYRWKGHAELPVFYIGRGLVENDAEGLDVVSGEKNSRVKPQKIKDMSKDAELVNADSGVTSGKKRPRGRPRKDQNVSENGKGGSSGAKSTSHASGKKPKVDDHNYSNERRSRGKRVDYLEMVSPSSSRSRSSPSSSRSRSAKVGERMCKVASKVQGSPPIFKSRQELHADSKDYSSADENEMLTQLCLIAENPMEDYSFRSTIISFFADFRAAVLIKCSEELVPSKSAGGRRGRKKRILDSESASSEELLPLKSAGRKRGRKKKMVDSEPSSSDELLSLKSSGGKRGQKKKMVDSERSSSDELWSSKSTGGKRGRKKKMEDSELATSDEQWPLKSSGGKRGRKKKLADSEPASSDEPQPLKTAGCKRGRKKKVANSEPASPDVPMADSYWNDLLLQSSPEREPVSRGRKRKKGSKGRKQKKKAKSVATVGNPSSPSLLEQQELAGDPPSCEVADEGASERPITDAMQKHEAGMEKHETGEGEGSDIAEMETETETETPTALILSFTESDALPSEADLTKIFSRYGPLKEAETEVLRKTNRAKVVFKSRANAEVAFSSAGKYSVFGPALVSYRLRYLPPSPKASPDDSAQDKKDGAPSEVGTAELPDKEDTSVASENKPAQDMGSLPTE